MEQKQDKDFTNNTFDLLIQLLWLIFRLVTNAKLRKIFKAGLDANDSSPEEWSKFLDKVTEHLQSQKGE